MTSQNSASEPEPVPSGSAAELPCVVCSQVDDHPKHRIPVVTPTAETLGEEESHHFDCGVTAGCDHCVYVRSLVPDGVTGDLARAHMLLNAPPTED